MRFVLSMYLLKAFSQEAVDPPLGPIMKPRYSAEGTTEKLDHSETICLMVLEMLLSLFGVGSIPN